MRVEYNRAVTRLQSAKMREMYSSSLILETEDTLKLNKNVHGSSTSFNTKINCESENIRQNGPDKNQQPCHCEPSRNQKKPKILLPNRDTASADLSTKPSAAVQPFNYVKFETATGETFYFSKYFRNPPNIENTSNGTKRQRIRTAFTDAHFRKLEDEYNKNRDITAKRCKELGLSLNLTDQYIKTWFQNRRNQNKREEMRIYNLDTEEDEPGTHRENEINTAAPLESNEIANSCGSTNQGTCISNETVNPVKTEKENELFKNKDLIVRKSKNKQSTNVTKKKRKSNSCGETSTYNLRKKQRLLKGRLLESESSE